MSLAAIADELYALPLDEFTAARNARAKADEQVKTLPKPSAAAWAINQFARGSRAKLEQVVALGDQLREAQDDLDSKTMRALGSQRRALLAAMAREITPTASLRAEIEQTLQAAMADPDAADAVLSGRLVRTLSSDGLEPVDLAGAVAVPTGRRPVKPKKKGPSAAQLTMARGAVERAESEQRGAATALSAAAKNRDTAQADEVKLTAAVEDLEARLAEARASRATAAGTAAKARKAVHAAETQRDRADAALDAAQDHLENLG